MFDEYHALWVGMVVLSDSKQEKRQYLEFMDQRGVYNLVPYLAFVYILSSQEQTKYLETTNDKGNKRLDFRFAY